jgi:hypothetical protein
LAFGEPEGVGVGGVAGGGGGALEPLEGGESVGLDAAALLLRELHGRRRGLHGPRLRCRVVEAWGLRGNSRRFLPLGENFFLFF